MDRTVAQRRWLLLLGALVLLLANGSLLFGWLNTPPGTRFVGIRTLLPADTPVYYSYIRQVQDGGWALRDWYTAEPQHVGTINLLWLAVGWLGKLLHLTPPVTFHVSRVLLGAPLLVALYWAGAQWLKQREERLAAWLLMLSGGIGIILVPFLPLAEYLDRGAGYRFPVDLWMPWGYPSLTLGQSPHLVASWLLQVLACVLAFRAIQRRDLRAGLIAGLVAAVWINFHPYHWPVLLLIPAVWFALRWVIERRPPLWVWPYVAPLFAGTALSLGYHRWLLAASPVVAERALQNVSRLPGWPYVLAGLGMVAPLALLNLWRQRRQFDAATTWLVAWVATAVLLMLLSTQFQARYLQGIFVPLAVLSAPPLVQLYRRISQRPIALIAAGAAFVALAYGSPVALAWRDITSYRRWPARVYFPQTFFAAAEFVRRTVPPGNPVVASHDSALFLPAYAGRVVYFGHGDETVDSAAKRLVVEQFYTTSDSTERKAILQRIGANYVWYGWFERALHGPDLSRAPGSVPVFANPDVTILWFE